MKKKIICCCVFFICISFIFAEGTESKKKFIKGNLYEKSTIVKQAPVNEVVELATDAIDFSINNKEILGDDKDLATLAVVGVTMLPVSYFDSIDDAKKAEINNKFLTLFNIFKDDVVRIAILNKLSNIDIPSEDFTFVLNEIMLGDDIISSNKNFIKTVINTLGIIGDSNSFDILYNLLNNNTWSNYVNDIENALGPIAQKSSKNVIDLIKKGSIADCRRIFDLIQKNEKNSQFFKAEVAENVLAQTIYIVGTTSFDDKELVSLQLDSIRVLTKYKWTRAARTMVAFFDVAVSEYEAKQMSHTEFIEVIKGVSVIVPIEAVSICSNCLVGMNKKKESGKFSESDEKVVLALISALGAIGDKAAFDSLLAVTYYNYSDNVITAARNALARLKW